MAATATMSITTTSKRGNPLAAGAAPAVTVSVADPWAEEEPRVAVTVIVTVPALLPAV